MIGVVLDDIEDHSAGRQPGAVLDERLLHHFDLFRGRVLGQDRPVGVLLGLTFDQTDGGDLRLGAEQSGRQHFAGHVDVVPGSLVGEADHELAVSYQVFLFVLSGHPFVFAGPDVGEEIADVVAVGVGAGRFAGPRAAYSETAGRSCSFRTRVATTARVLLIGW